MNFPGVGEKCGGPEFEEWKRNDAIGRAWAEGNGFVPADQTGTETPAEPAPVEQAPATELPATQPAPAQQSSPQYTG